MASLVEQIYMQAQGGSAGGQGFADFLAQGRQTNQRQQQIEAQKQQLAAELAQIPLRQTLMRQDAEMNALKIQDVLEQRQFALEDEKTVSTAWEWVSKDLKDKNPTGALTTWMDFAGQLPRLTQNPKFLQLRKDIETSLQIATDLAKIRPSGQVYQPGFGTDVDPVTGKRHSFFRTGAGSAELVKDDADKPLSPLGKLLEERDRAAALGQTKRVEAFDKEIELGRLRNVDPAALTTATKSRLQEQSLNNDEALMTLEEAITGIRETPEAIGVRGKVGEFAEKVRGQISPGASMETPITDVRQKASIAFSRLAPALRIDSGNMSRYELNKLEQAGDVLGVNEAPQTALKKLNNLQATVVARELRIRKTQGKAADDALLRRIQGEEIAALLADKLLTKEEALRLYQLNRPNGR